MKITSSFAEGCQKGQKAINADHLYMFSNNLLDKSRQTETDKQINGQTDTNIHTHVPPSFHRSNFTEVVQARRCLFCIKCGLEIVRQVNYAPIVTNLPSRRRFCPRIKSLLPILQRLTLTQIRLKRCTVAVIWS